MSELEQLRAWQAIGGRSAGEDLKIRNACIAALVGEERGSTDRFLDWTIAYLTKRIVWASGKDDESD